VKTEKNINNKLTQFKSMPFKTIVNRMLEILCVTIARDAGLQQLEIEKVIGTIKILSY
jgi:hypothetical protein